jgi:hypothetical protein
MVSGMKAAGSGLRPLPEAFFGVQEICETWKLRTPNDWEPIHWWSQLLSWRNQVMLNYIC